MDRVMDQAWGNSWSFKYINAGGTDVSLYREGSNGRLRRGQEQRPRPRRKIKRLIGSRIDSYGAVARSLAVRRRCWSLGISESPGRAVRFPRLGKWNWKHFLNAFFENFKWCLQVRAEEILPS